MADYRKLEVWKRAHELAVASHGVAVKIKGANYVSLRSQLIRAAVSIPANIVEGSEQRSKKEFVRFLRYSTGSASELEYHLLFARSILIVSTEDHDNVNAQLVPVRKMLFGLISSLEE